MKRRMLLVGMLAMFAFAAMGQEGCDVETTPSGGGSDRFARGGGGGEDRLSNQGLAVVSAGLKQHM